MGGGASQLKNLCEYFNAEMGLPVEVMNPLNRITMKSKTLNISELEDQKNLLGVGIGLALRKVLN